MYEKRKLDEAKYFYSRMKKTKRGNRKFTYNLSAFLSASRSILQYTYCKVKDEPYQSWYDDYMSNSKLLQFFKDRRDFNIHEKPVNPRIKVGIREKLSLSESLTVKRNGEILFQSENRSGSEENKHDSQTDVEISYIFEEWDGDETVLELCEEYITKLEKLVDEGIEKGVIS